MPARERDWRVAGRPARLKAVQKCGTGEEPERERSNGKALNFHASESGVRLPPSPPFNRISA